LAFHVRVASVSRRNLATGNQTNPEFPGILNCFSVGAVVVLRQSLDQFLRDGNPRELLSLTSAGLHFTFLHSIQTLDAPSTSKLTNPDRLSPLKRVDFGCLQTPVHAEGSGPTCDTPPSICLAHDLVELSFSDSVVMYVHYPLGVPRHANLPETKKAE
jgi:hypothetical protein